MALDDLIARARLESGLRNNAYYDDTSIVRYLDAGGAELADIFTQANQHYVIKTFDFTSAAGVAGAIQTLPTDFQQGHSLEIYPDSPGLTRTIKFLPNWLNRNSYAGAAFPATPGGGPYPAYTFLGNQLRFYPPQMTPAAPFRLYYTPQWTPFVAPRTINADVSGGDTTGGGTGWSLVNGNFTAADVGSIITPNLAAPNLAFNIPYTITSVLSATFVHTNPAPSVTPGGSFTNPDSGSFRVENTLPLVMAPWSEYLVVYAAIAINTDRQRGTADLERKLQALKARVSSTVAVRQEEPQQPPLTRDMDGGIWGGGWGSGGSGWGW